MKMKSKQFNRILQILENQINTNKVMINNKFKNWD